jgi:hypothetical protein
MQAINRPFLGFGLGLRAEHYKDILTTNPSMSFEYSWDKNAQDFL